ncbi:MAG TPA: response regulator [Candidatus Acidoferrum sp.]|nr:response regulator [Candidatus Acidoferrum sp.]
MRRFINSSIRRQLTLVVLCTSLFGLGIVYATFELYERASFRRGLTEELSTLADTVGANSAASLTFYDKKSAEEVLAGLGAEHHILAACLFNTYGQAFAEYRRPGISREFHITFSQDEGTHFAPDSLTLRRAIFMGGEKIGSIAIVSDLAELQAKMRGYNEISALALLLSILATVFISSRLLRLITAPILQLAEVAGRVSSEENYALRAIPQSNDEVGRLIHSFNGMLERIQERDTKLKEINDDLELRVQARTKELQLEVEQRKQTEHRLQASLKELEDFKFALDQHCNVSRTDPEGFITFVNENFCAVSKYSPEEMLGNTHRTVTSGRHPREFFAQLWRTIKGGQCWKGEVQNKAKDGTFYWSDTTIVPFSNPQGKQVQYIAIRSDITKLKRIEEELRSEVTERIRAKETLSAERAILRALIDNVPDYMYVKDTDCRFLLANVAVARQMGAKGPEELLGKTDFDFYPSDLATTFFEDEQKVIRAGQAEINREESGMDPQGNLSHVLTTQVPLRGRNGQVIGLVGIGHDITHLKKIQEEMQRAREAAEAASRAKSEFLANMSHEIRTPLNGIMGMTDLALETELGREQREYLETVKISADSLLTVINDILDFSKIEAGKIDLESVDFDVRDGLESALKTLAVRADEKGLELLCEVAPEVPEIARGDITRLRQVLLNLVGNAIKFTNEGEVAVKVQQEAKDEHGVILHFTVSDTGIGIPENKHEMIFAPFAQADTSTTRKYGGTGLGLTISNRLVQMMDGRIWVESEESRGSDFHFTVRLQIADRKEVKVSSPVPPEVLRGVRVLVVDDNQTNRRILEGMLRRWGMVPALAESGEQALAKLASALNEGKAYALIVTDMHMPKMDGFELVEQIRERPELCTATIMMLTSAGHRGDAQRCQKLGVSAYLLKPIRQSELREAIAKVLGVREQEGAIPLVTRYSLGDARDRLEVLRILVAEDNLVNQRLIARLLEKRGHRVVVAANGREALAALEKAALEKETFDILFMDVQMPEMDGFEATAAVRKKEKSSGLHQMIVALTAHAMKGDHEKCLAAGMDGYLSKPIRPQELDDVLARFGARHPVTA